MFVPIEGRMRNRIHRYLEDRKSTRLNSSHSQFSYAVFCLKKKWDANAMFEILRVISDFKSEFLMNQLNRHMAPDVVKMNGMAQPQVSFVSSSGVKCISACR